MNPGGIYDRLDPDLIDRVTLDLARDFLTGSAATMRRLADDDRLTPPTVIAAVVRAHLLGAASMVAAAKPAVDSLVLVTWLIEALGEALADVASVETAL